jgi:hypothetical protein
LKGSSHFRDGFPGGAIDGGIIPMSHSVISPFGLLVLVDGFLVARIRNPGALLEEIRSY